MRKIDRAALELALQQTLTEKDHGRVEQVQWMLEKRARLEVSQFCSFHRQIESLHLKPWELPPCLGDLDNGSGRDEQAWRLLKRMQKAGVSRWHPSPIAACEAAEKARGSRSSSGTTKNRSRSTADSFSGGT
jgi:hypothetical protein